MTRKAFDALSVAVFRSASSFDHREIVLKAP